MSALGEREPLEAETAAVSMPPRTDEPTGNTPSRSPSALYRLKPDDPDYGHICECGSPKHRQSRRCAACYIDRRRAGLYPDPPTLRGAAHPNWKASGHTGHRATGRSRGRPQPQDHPWRKAEKLRLSRLPS